MYSSVALDASGRVGSSFLYVVCILVLAVPLLVPLHVPSVASPSVICSLLFLLWSDTPSSARSQWALPTVRVMINTNGRPIALTLLKKYKDVAKNCEEHKCHFDEFSHVLPDHSVRQWMAMAEKWEEDPGNNENPFATAVPSKSTLLQRLLPLTFLFPSCDNGRGSPSAG